MKRILPLAFVLCAAPAGATPVEDAVEDAVDFARQVRPILAESCFGCHGPDDATREADLRLDTEQGLFGDRGGHAAVVPGAPDQSELWARLRDADDPMPPASAQDALDESELDTIRSWIEQGAQWSRHWAFEPPVRHEPPAFAAGAQHASWPRNEIDRFVLGAMLREGLEPSPEADRSALLRRSSFDLTGLPPTPAEIDAFLADAEEGAYERAVERLLASPRYGERQAQDWLDLARYADSNGDGYDGGRDMWTWRAWVIESFNANKPFDELTVEQLAGDLLPDATRSQRLATGFHRNHPIFTKPGVAEDEYRNAYVADRVDTTATVWLGLTLACAQCHDHKYDPLSQKDYYRLYAYFNNVSEDDVGRGGGNSRPVMVVPDEEQGAKLDELEEKIEALDAVLTGDHADYDAEEAAWKREMLEQLGPDVEWTTLEPVGLVSLGGAHLELQDDGSIVANGPSPAQDVYHFVTQPGRRKITGLRLEVLPDERFPAGGSGRSEKGTFVLSELEVQLTSVLQGDQGEKVRFLRGEDDVAPDRSVDADKAVDGGERSGWSLVGDEVKQAHEAVFVPSEPLELVDTSILRFEFGQRFGFFYRNTIGRFRLSYTEDERILRRRVPVVPSAWHAVGPFPGKTSEEALATAFAPEQGIVGGVDLEAKYEKVELEREERGRGGDGAKPAEEFVGPPAPPALEREKRGKPNAPQGEGDDEDGDEDGFDPDNFDPADFDPGDFDPAPPEGGDFGGRRRRGDGKLAWEEKLDWRDGGRMRVSGASSAWYLHRSFDADRARDVRFLYEGSDALRVWCNGEVVFERAATKPVRRRSFGGGFEDDDEERARRRPDYEHFDVALRAGENEVVIKLVGGERGGSLTLRTQPLGRDVLSYAAERALVREAAAQRAALQAAGDDPPAAPAGSGGFGGAQGVDADETDETDEPDEPDDEPDPAQARRVVLREWFRRYVSSAARAQYDEYDALRMEQLRIEAELPTSMVLDDEEPRETHVLMRGEYDAKGERVEPGVPAVLPPLPADAPANRLALARWLVSGENPLTARVAVNRIWAQHFGTGIVATTNDFGTRGDLPSHPELLDWLATEFVASGWDVKALHRAIVTSATYRQSAAATPERLERDPGNRWLARAPRKRLSAEAIRDNALFVSGLLVEEIGGESVKPYQPEGLWATVGGYSGDRYRQDEGDKLYRRGLYVFWKRGILYPSFAIFDAPARSTCTSERVETNTPLQSFVLLNDPVYVEAARALATRMIGEGGADVGTRLAFGFRLCTSRLPSEKELAILARILAEQRAHWADDEEAAKEYVSVGATELAQDADVKELAAWTSVASVLLNLDATIHGR